MRVFLGVLAGAVAAGCATASVPLLDVADGGSGVAPGTGAGSGAGSAGPTGGAGGNSLSSLPVRVRRLTDDEWRASATSLFGVTSQSAASFTPDSTQTGFAVNDAQQVDPVLAGQIDAAAHEIAAAAALLPSTAPCADPTNGGDACAQSFIAALVPQAYRRPATQSELDGLLVVYHAAADGGAYTDGIQAVIAAVLESPGFIYVTEMGSTGDTVTGDTVTMTSFEIASELSFLLTGNPPDSALVSAARAAQLQDPSVRQSHARRLLKTANAKAQLTKVVEQWLGIDSIASIAKDTTVYPDFASQQQAMTQEADDFISEIVWNEGKGVADLFGATFTIAGATLASFYGAPPPDATGRVSLAGTGRTGLLDQGAFLSVYAHASESGPVLRGVAILRNVACVTIPDPSSLNIVVVPPAPDPTKTTRQRYAVHATDPKCASCHAVIDSLGFAFENFDGEGKKRTTDATPPLPVDSTTTIASTTADLGGSYSDSSALAAQIANSAAVRECFARKMFQYAAARNDSDSAVKSVEDAFVSTWSALPASSQDSLIEVLVAYAGSPSFITRKVVQ